MCSQCAWLDSWGESLGCLPFCPAGWRTLCCVLLLLGAREGGPRGLQRSPSEVTMLESSREKETKQGWDWHPVSLKYFIWSVTKWSGGDSFRYKFWFALSECKWSSWMWVISSALIVTFTAWLLVQHRGHAAVGLIDKQNKKHKRCSNRRARADGPRSWNWMKQTF